jgi:pyridoxine kinase
MGRILAISSQVVRGHVGLSAIVPALQRIGHEVLPVPTILLSNHPGHPRAAGTRVEVNTLMSVLEVLDANGWIADLDAIITGYLPTPAHVLFASKAIDLVRQNSAKAVVVVDPVMGDDPRGLYIDGDAAAAIRATLIPRADVITPNRFEVSWLSGHEVRSVSDIAVAAAALTRSKVSRPELAILATSVPAGDDHLANVGVSGLKSAATTAASLACRVARVAKAPHGTGDLLTGLYIGFLIAGHPADVALGRAVAGVQQAIINSKGRNDLLLAVQSDAEDWSRVAALPVASLTVEAPSA